MNMNMNFEAHIKSKSFGEMVVCYCTIHHNTYHRYKYAGVHYLFATKESCPFRTTCDIIIVPVFSQLQLPLTEKEAEKVLHPIF